MADWNYDGVLDAVVLRNDGKLLFRAGSNGGSFEAPVVVNPDSADAIRDVTLASLNGFKFLVAIKAETNSVAFYTIISGPFVQVAEPVVPGILPSRLLFGDVDGDMLEDLVVTSAASGKVFVYLQRPSEDISVRPPNYQIDVGNGISDVALVDVNGDGLSEIVVTDQVSGDVRVLLNSADTPFASQLRFRAGVGLASVAQVADSVQVQSRDLSIGVVAGLFNDDAIPDLAVLNQSVNRVDILLGDGHGGVFNPTATTALLTGPDPVDLVTADFNNDGHADLAVLNQGSADLSIFLNDGHGGFTESTTTDSAGRMRRISAGNLPSGLTVGDINADGELDLLLGNEQGDVLTILGNGDGTFRPYQRIDRRVGLAITGLDSDAGPEFAVFDQSLDRVTYQSNESGSSFEQGREDGLLAPNAVEFADLNSDGIDDLIVSNGGSNEVLVYLGLAGDQFDLGHRFFVGTDPEAITISDLNGDGIADLVVANFGSNDLSLLFGQGRGDDWTLLAGPRLRAGGGPIATAVADLNADGTVDILVANHDSDDVYLLVGSGQGFFNDKQPVISRTGSVPVQVFVGNFDGDSDLEVVTVNAGSHDLTVISGLGQSELIGARTVRLSATDPVAAIAQDFNRDGLSDLIVAHQSGQFTLWLGGSNVVQAINAQDAGHLTNISELVLGQVTANSVEVYFTSSGNTTATLATFAFNFNSAPPTSFDFFSSFTPLPAAVSTFSSPVFSVNTVTSSGNELVDIASLDRSGSLTLLPIALFNSESGVTMAEFSSASGSQLEVIATLVLGFREALTDGTSPEETDSDELAVADKCEPASARDLLVTGATETPIQQHLQDRTNPETATEILFSSPLDLFDVSHPVATTQKTGERGGVSPPVLRRTTGRLTLNGTHLNQPERASVRFGERTIDKPDASAFRLIIAPIHESAVEHNQLDDRTDADSSPIHLCALVVCFAVVVPLTKDGRQVRQNLGRTRITPLSGEISNRKIPS